MVKIITLILMLIPLCAKAESTYLYTETSVAGETMDAFVLRIAHRAMRVTNKMGVEVCGEVEEVDRIYRVVIATSNDQFSCELPNTGKPYFHTHPASSIGTFSPADKKYEGYLAAKGRVYYSNGRLEKRVGKIKGM